MHAVKILLLQRIKIIEKYYILFNLTKIRINLSNETKTETREKKEI